MFANSNRREFLQSFSAAAVGAGMIGTRQRAALAAEADGKPLYRISLAEWSLHRTINAGKLDNLDFAKTAKEEFDIDAVEYINQFFKDKAQDKKYLAELAARAEDHGVQNLLIMVDGEGALGDADEAQRKQAIENHHKWLEAARFLGCHSIRVNAASSGTYDEQLDRAADGLARLGELADQFGLNVLVENHGGMSSNGAWLAGVMEKVARPNVGTLPDFGNFETSPGERYDRYQGVKELMPYAKAVSAKSHEFDAQGNEVRTDYRRMMKIVLDAGYRGYVGIEWEGAEPDEIEGIRLTKKLLERVREELS